MKQYHDCVKYILENGEDVSDRTGVGTRSVFGYQMRFNLQDGFPAITTKKLAWKSVVAELLWMLSGSTDERRLAEFTYGRPREELVDKRTIWTDNADNQGVNLGYRNDDEIKELGPVYGFNFRNFDHTPESTSGVDQIRNSITQIKENPDSRRIVVSAWNPMLLKEAALVPCHTIFQFKVINCKLHCFLFMRSNDVGLGMNFNHAFYALLTHIVARECNLEVGDLIHSVGDCHIYNDHIEPLREMLTREPYPPPKLVIDDNFNLMDRLDNGFLIKDTNSFKLEGYQHHPIIKMKMAI